MRVLITGVAGFIGARVAERLLARGDEVFGLDNLNDYYDPALKRARLSRTPSLRFHLSDITRPAELRAVFEEARPQRVIHLAAQAGVRFSMTHPALCAEANLMGFCHVLEACRDYRVEQLVYASSSSVYGASQDLPYATTDRADEPLSFYGATKRANELMAKSYAHLFGLSAVGLRFFSVYGPWGRPDMAFFKFTQNILAGQSLELHNEGHHRRDFTYIDDVAEAVARVVGRPEKGHRLYNVGCGAPVWLDELVDLLERALGKQAHRTRSRRMQEDMADTFADVSELERDFGFRPSTSLEVGVRAFVDWYRTYYRA